MDKVSNPTDDTKCTQKAIGYIDKILTVQTQTKGQLYMASVWLEFIESCLYLQDETHARA